MKKYLKENLIQILILLLVDSAATLLLNKVILEGSTTKADIILGLDMNLLDDSQKIKFI